MRIATRLVLILCTSLVLVFVLFAGFAQRRQERLIRTAFLDEVVAAGHVIRMLFEVTPPEQRTPAVTQAAGEPTGITVGLGDAEDLIQQMLRDPRTFVLAVVDTAARPMLGGPEDRLTCIQDVHPPVAEPRASIRGWADCDGGVAWVGLAIDRPPGTLVFARHAELVDEHIAASRRIFLRALLAIVLTASFVNIVVLRRTLSDPLNSILAAVRAADGRLAPPHVRVRRSAGELAELGDAFNDMGARVDRAHHEADRALAQAQKAAADKERFFATAAHELKTPVGAATGFIDLLLMRLHGPITAEQADVLARVRENLVHIRQLVDDLMDLARIAAGRIEFVPERIDLPELLEDMIAAVRPAAEGKGLTLTLRTADGPRRVRADPLRLKQILLNLLSNAVKFTDHGRIAVSWGWAPKTVGPPGRTGAPAAVEAGAHAAHAPPRRGFFIAVEDTGPGIPPELHGAIFEEFRQTELGRQRRGTGLGLAISKRLAERMGGDIHVRSEIGRGSTFTLWLPLGPHRPVANAHPA